MSYLIRPVNDCSCSLAEDFSVFPGFRKLFHVGSRKTDRTGLSSQCLTTCLNPIFCCLTKKNHDSAKETYKFSLQFNKNLCEKMFLFKVHRFSGVNCSKACNVCLLFAHPSLVRDRNLIKITQRKNFQA